MNIHTLPIVIIGGGQSGLAAAHAAHRNGLRPVVLEAGDEPTGSWGHYYDSLTAFSPNRFNRLAGVPFPGDPDHHPRRDEVVAYLRAFAAGLDVDIRTRQQVTAVTRMGARYRVAIDGGDPIDAAGVVAASGSFANPVLPVLSGQGKFTGTIRHVASYREPGEFAGQRVVVIGAGNSAVQVAYELADVARVTIASRAPIKFMPQRVAGRDVHYLLAAGLDRIPATWLSKVVRHTPVLDTGDYSAALKDGRLERRELPHGFDRDHLIWADGRHEQVDAVIFATGYRPDLEYLDGLGALDRHGMPHHDGGVSTTHPGLAYVGLEFQRSFASNTLRGVHRDAGHVMAAMAAVASGSLSPT